MFNFTKLLSFSGMWMLINDTAAATTFKNDSQEKVYYVNFPDLKDIHSFYTDLFYCNAAGQLNVDKQKRMVWLSF